MYQNQLIPYLLFSSLVLTTVYAQSATCNTAQNCTRTVLNPSASNPPVQCLANRCECADTCFLFNNNSASLPDTCVLNTQCFQYSLIQGCENTARGRIIALLLQIFLGVLGAANFYIGQFAFGGGQLFVFILMLILSCALEVLQKLLMKKLKNKDDNSIAKISLLIATLIIALLALIVSAIVIIWWVVDVIIFAVNSRVDLNGCVLA